MSFRVSPQRFSIALAVALLAIVSPALDAGASVAKCFGERATIVSSDSTIEGTPRDDVIVSRATGDANRILARGGDDLVCGSDGEEIIRGGPGNDRANGNGDVDRLSGGPGDDTMLGGGSFGGAGVGGPGFGGDFMTGGSGADRLYGQQGFDTIAGGRGTDLVAGGEDADVLKGGAGPDTLRGGDGLDVFVPGSDDDKVYGGSGDPELNFDIFSAGEATGPVVVNLKTGSASGPGIGTDSIVGIEVVSGSDFNDRLVGSDADNIFFGGPGDDIFDGGKGFDVIAYLMSPSGVQADLQAGEGTGSQYLDDEGRDIGEGSDTYARVEGVIGSPFGDVLVGDDQENYLDGVGDDDELVGADGDDWLDGGEGSDALDGGIGVDVCLSGGVAAACERDEPTTQHALAEDAKQADTFRRNFRRNF